ncbi:LacI family DNA-binding transcriptional regulator [soil metagenome]
MADLEDKANKAAPGTISTIYDVSELAGVSASTVSRTFSRPEMISDATREKVFAAAKQLGYRPNTLAGSLTTKRTLLIGLLTTDIQNPFVASLARGVQDGIALKRYLSIICSTDGDAVRELDLLEEMLARGVDGFILTPPFDGPDPSVGALLRDLPARGVPVVFIGHQNEDSSSDFATSGAKNGEVEAVNHLISLGHSRIGFIGGYYTRGIGVGRWRGYREALQVHGLAPIPELELETDTTSESGSIAMNTLLNLSEPPTAVVTVNDLVAIGALDACREQGIEVPNQMSIIGFDDILIASLVTPPLTTVAQPAYELGRTAAKLILNRLHTPDLPAQQIVLGCKLIVRGTTARCHTSE